MIRIKMLKHKNQDVYEIDNRKEGRKFFEDISKDGLILDPIEVYKGTSIIKGEASEENDMLQFGFTLSDSSVDRDDERILVKGWDLKDFKKNPVLLWSHDHSRPAIGYMKDMKKVDVLSGTAVFVPKSVDHFGWSIGQKLDLGILSSGSVGFWPLEYKFIDEQDDPAWLEFQKQALLEFSICNVPSNPNAHVSREIEDGLVKMFEDMEKGFDTRLKSLEDMFNEAANQAAATSALDSFFEKVDS
jgi:HK97 family phage prohead protease